MGVALLNVYSVHVMNNIHTIDTMASHNSLMQKATDADGLLTAARADVMKHCPTLLIFCFASYTAVYGAYIVMHITHSTILVTHMPIKFHIIIHVCGGGEVQS